MYKKIFIIILIFLSVTSLTAATGKVNNYKGMDVTIAIKGNSANFYPGQLMYVTENGETICKIKIYEVLHSFIKGKIIFGKIKKGAFVTDNQQKSYRRFINNAMINNILSYYRDLVYDNKTQLFFDELDKLTDELKIANNYDFNEEYEIRRFLAESYNAVLNRGEKQRSAYKDYLLLVYNLTIKKKNIKNDLNLFLKKYPHSVFTDDVLYLKAKIFFDSSSYFNSIVTCREIIKHYLDSDQIFKTTLLLAKSYYYITNYVISLKYTVPLIESDEKSYHRDQARFLRFKIFLAQQDNKKAIKELEILQKDPQTVTLLQESLFLEYTIMLYKLNDRLRAAQLSKYMADKFPDSKYLPEINFLNVTYNSRENNPLITIKELKKIIEKYPSSPAGFKSYQKIASILADLNRIKEVYELYENFRDNYPDQFQRYSISSLVAEKYINNLLTLQNNPSKKSSRYNILLPYNKDKEHYSAPLITNKFYKKMLSKSRTFFEVKPFHITNEFSIINQTLSTANYFLELVLDKPSLYEDAVINNTLIQLFRLYMNFSIDTKTNIIILEKSLSAIISPKNMEIFNYQIFKYYKKSDIELAQKAAFKILESHKNGSLVTEIFLFFAAEIRKEDDIEYKLALYDRIKRSYRKSDSHMDQLRLEINGRQLIFYDPKGAKTTAGKLILPTHAKVFNKENEFQLFDLFKDFSLHGYRKDYLYLRVNGENPRIESRLIHLKAYKYNIIAITLNSRPGNTLQHGNIQWQTWDDFDWVEENKIPFSLSGDGEYTINISLKNKRWRNEIKRIRINIFDGNNNKDQNDLYLKNIIIY